MHDNAPGHRAHATRGWLAANNISVFVPNRPKKKRSTTMVNSSGGMGKYQHVGCPAPYLFNAPSMHSISAGGWWPYKILKLRFIYISIVLIRILFNIMLIF